jgi:general secretion pathway protein E
MDRLPPSVNGPAAPLRFSRRIPYAFARDRGVIVREPSEDPAAALQVWARPALDGLTLSELRRVFRRPVRLEWLAPEAFAALLAQAYAQRENSAQAVMGDLGQDADLQRLAQEMPEVTDLLDAEDDAPIIRLINALFTQALREQASDIHIEAFEHRSVVRFRVDGTLRDVIEPQRALHAAMVSRIKIMASLDIAEKRLPQDGRLNLRLAGRPVDVRVSTLPTGHGERVVLRLLDKQSGRLQLERLGMEATLLAQLDRMIREPHGIVLVTGPTGSGKTTTLYAALSRLDSGVLNMMTVEDPIEYDLDGVGQTQVNPRIELTFARALRSILRQDPDVIMIGEVRDLETAQIAVQASLTGHLVMATLHTNDSVGAVTRLVDMGVEPFLLSSSVLGVLAQRLVRLLCPQCRRPVATDAALRGAFGDDALPGQVWHAVGCTACNGTGYQGRTGIYELLPVDDGLRTLIHDRASEQALRAHAESLGMRNLRHDGLRWLVDGRTSPEEILRVTRS